MGLEFFAQQCNAQATGTDALIWCVMKKHVEILLSSTESMLTTFVHRGTCCGICSDTLASLGTRIGLTFAVFFATLVIVIDSAETPFLFLTTSLQALAYILTVLWEGLGGKGISRFHAYYALFCSFGWMAPLAAASLTATHYGYGGTHPRSGVRLLCYRTDYGRSTKPERHSNDSTANSFSRRTRALPPHITSYHSLGSTRSSSSSRSHSQERLPLVDSMSSIDSSPLLSAPAERRAERRKEFGAMMTRSRSNRIPEDCKEREEERQPTRATPSSLLGFTSSTSNQSSRDASEEEKIGPARRAETFDSEASIQDRVLRRRLGQASRTTGVPRSSQRYRTTTTTSTTQDPGRSSVETVYTPEQLRKIASKVNDRKWRRHGYPLSVGVLWSLWLFVFLLIDERIPGFSLTQTNCPDPEGTELLKVSSMIFLACGPFVLLFFVLNYHTQWLPRQLRRILDFNRNGSLYTRFLLPGVFSAVVFALWQSLLWQGYELAARPESSLLAETEQSTTFATVLSLALTIKPVTDLVKSLTRLHKRKIRERREAQEQASPFFPGQTPTVLPDLRLPELEKFAPLEAPAIPLSRNGPRRRGSNDKNVAASRPPAACRQQTDPSKTSSTLSTAPATSSSSHLSSTTKDDNLDSNAEMTPGRRLSHQTANSISSSSRRA